MMIECGCEQCGGEFPMNETFRVEERVLCGACCDKLLAQEHPRPGDVQRQSDPTVCANCRRDNGTAELPQLAGLPVCGSCEAFFRNRPFPLWIKVALAAVLSLVAVSLVWNVRFYRAYMAVRQSPKDLAQGQVEAAAAQMASAAAWVPESQEIRTLAAYLQGIVLLRQNKSAEALEKLVQCRNRVPPECDLESLILQAQIGVAFDAKDYDGFLSASQALNQRLPQDHMVRAGLASAWACKYAVTGDAACREQALSCLKQAQEMARGDPAFQEYEQRIRHRLQTREIITAQEFHQRFPNGWTEQREE